MCVSWLLVILRDSYSHHYTISKLDGQWFWHRAVKLFTKLGHHEDQHESKDLYWAGLHATVLPPSEQIWNTYCMAWGELCCVWHYMLLCAPVSYVRLRKKIIHIAKYKCHSTEGHGPAPQFWHFGGRPSLTISVIRTVSANICVEQYNSF